VHALAFMSLAAVHDGHAIHLSTLGYFTDLNAVADLRRLSSAMAEQPLNTIANTATGDEAPIGLAVVKILLQRYESAGFLD